MQATRGRTTDIEQQNLTVPAKKRSGFLADVAEVSASVPARNVSSLAMSDCRCPTLKT